VKRLGVVLALLACGCSAGVLRIAADVFGVVCAVAGHGAERRPVAFDIYPDGGVRPVYAESPR
jgi:hypothetical protein